MNKKLLYFLMLVPIIMISATVGAFAATDGITKLFVNGKQVTTDLQIIDGRSFVPLRAVAELLGADVTWESSSKSVFITGKDYLPDQGNVLKTKSYDTNVKMSSGPMTLIINKVTLDPAYTRGQYSEICKVIIMDVTIENTSSEEVKWYVNQGDLKLNTNEEIPSGLQYSDQDMGGKFIGKEQRKGNVVFQLGRHSNLSDINSMTLSVKGPFNDHYDQLGMDMSVDIILK